MSDVSDAGTVVRARSGVRAETAAGTPALLAAGLAAFAASVIGYIVMVRSVPGPLWTLPDATVYRDAGSALRHGSGLLYTAKFGDPPLDYLYTPFAALGFAGASYLPPETWKYALTALGVASVVYVSYASLGAAGVRMSTGRRLGVALLLAAAALWLEPVQRTLSFGQINLVLLALVALDLSTPQDRARKGIGIGIAAGIKLTPLIFVAYLLFSRRRRAALVALGSFAATVAAGFAVAPADSAAYWLHGELLRSDVITHVLVNQSLRGFAERLSHGAPSGHLLYPVFAAAAAAAGLTVAVAAARRGDELLGLVVCGTTGLLISPVSWTHHWVYTVPALALTIPRPAGVWLRKTWTRVAFGAVLLALFTAWPVRLARYGGWDPSAGWSDGGLLRFQAHGGGPELAWSTPELILGDYYALAGLLLITCVGVSPLITRRRA